MGQLTKCSTCKFEFTSGHSHHTGDSRALCLQCKAVFVLPTASAWGPALGERITLWRQGAVVKRKKRQSARQPTDVSFQTVPGEEYELAGRRQSTIRYPIADVSCPDCQKPSLVLDFADGAPCPQCQKGQLRCSPILY